MLLFGADCLSPCRSKKADESLCEGIQGQARSMNTPTGIRAKLRFEKKVNIGYFAMKGLNVAAQGETLGCRFAADLRPEGAQHAVEPLL